MSLALVRRPLDRAAVPAGIPLRGWPLYRGVLAAARAAGLPFAIGAGLALSVYTGRRRRCRDLDLYTLPAHRHELIALLTRQGFADYHAQKTYDRRWIYRGCRDGLLVDVMWQMANYRTEVDEGWLTRGPEIELGDQTVRLIPIEELLWSKLYVLQPQRSDWQDLLNLLHAAGQRVDWARLLDRLGDDAGLLGGLLAVFRWLCPTAATALPSWVWGRVGLSERRPDPPPGVDGQWADRLDRSDWFGPPAPAPDR